MRYPPRLVPVLLVFATTAAATAAAQVGHPPDRSPYSYIRRGHTITAVGGQINGNGGQFGIGPHDGVVFGGRYDLRTSHTIQLGVEVSHGEFDRLIVDPFAPVNHRVSGPVTQQVTFAELDVQLNLTGEKTWHRIAPFIGSGVGVTFASSTPADTSGFEFGRKAYFAPQAGLRIFLSRRVHLRAEARTAFWKVSYPASFQQATLDQPNAVITNGRTSEWTANTWFKFGLGFGFSP